MAEQNKATVEFENDEAVAEEIRTDINPQDIVQNPSEYAEQMAAQRGSDHDKMAGFTVPRDYVILPSKGRVYPVESPLLLLMKIF